MKPNDTPGPESRQPDYKPHCPVCGGLAGLWPNGQCPTCYVKAQYANPKPDSTGELEQQIAEKLSEYSIHPQETHIDGCSYEDDDTTCNCEYSFVFHQYKPWMADMLALIRQRDEAIRERLLEAVGEDEPIMERQSTPPYDHLGNLEGHNTGVIARNLARAELRQAIQAIYGGEKPNQKENTQ